MTIFSPSDIKMYYSGASVVSGTQTDPSTSLGGNMSSTEIPNVTLMSLFDIVSGSEIISGSDSYRAVFVSNTHTLLSFNEAKVYFNSRTGYNNDLIYFGLETPIGYSIQQVVDEHTSPTGIMWYYPVDVGSAITVGDFGPGDIFGVWFKREFVATASGVGQRNDWFSLMIEGQVI